MVVLAMSLCLHEHKFIIYTLEAGDFKLFQRKQNSEPRYVEAPVYTHRKRFISVPRLINLAFGARGP